MKEMLRYGLVLGLICVLASGALAIVNSLTQSRIISQAQAEEEASLKEVLPEAECFKPVKQGDEVIYYQAYDKTGRFIGAAFKASAKGYSSTIETMAGLTADGQISNIKILSQNETPGLGAQVVEPFFTGQFRQKSIQDLKNIDAITGATISSQAVIDALAKKAAEIKDLIQDAK